MSDPTVIQHDPSTLPLQLLELNTHSEINSTIIDIFTIPNEISSEDLIDQARTLGLCAKHSKPESLIRGAIGLSKLIHTSDKRKDKIRNSFTGHSLLVGSIYLDICRSGNIPPNLEDFLSSIGHDWYEDGIGKYSDEIEVMISEAVQSSEIPSLNVNVLASSKRLSKVLDDQGHKMPDAKYFEQVSGDPKAIRIKCADRIANLRDDLQTSDPYKAQRYLAESEEMLTIFGPATTDPDTLHFVTALSQCIEQVRPVINSRIEQIDSITSQLNLAPEGIEMANETFSQLNSYGIPATDGVRISYYLNSLWQQIANGGDYQQSAHELEKLVSAIPPQDLELLGYSICLAESSLNARRMVDALADFNIQNFFKDAINRTRPIAEDLRSVLEQIQPQLLAGEELSANEFELIKELQIPYLMPDAFLGIAHNSDIEAIALTCVTELKHFSEMQDGDAFQKWCQAQKLIHLYAPLADLLGLHELYYDLRTAGYEYTLSGTEQYEYERLRDPDVLDFTTNVLPKINAALKTVIHPLPAEYHVLAKPTALRAEKVIRSEKTRQGDEISILIVCDDEDSEGKPNSISSFVNMALDAVHKISSIEPNHPQVGEAKINIRSRQTINHTFREHDIPNLPQLSARVEPELSERVKVNLAYKYDSDPVNVEVKVMSRSEYTNMLYGSHNKFTLRFLETAAPTVKPNTFEQAKNLEISLKALGTRRRMLPFYTTKGQTCDKNAVAADSAANRLQGLNRSGTFDTVLARIGERTRYPLPQNAEP
jgi:hypothetical protein